MEQHDNYITEGPGSSQGQVQQQEEPEHKSKKKTRKFTRRQAWRRKQKSPKKKREQRPDTELDPRQLVNISTHMLTPAQTSVLNKGLGYCPTPRNQKKTYFHTNNKPVSNHLNRTHNINGLPQVIDKANNDLTSRVLRATSWLRQLATSQP